MMNDIPGNADSTGLELPDETAMTPVMHPQFPNLSNLSSWLYEQSARLRQAPSSFPYDGDDQITQALHQQREQLVSHFSDIRTQVSVTYHQFAHALESTHDLLTSLKTQLGYTHPSDDSGEPLSS